MTSFDLTTLGWDDTFAAELPAGSVPGKIARVHSSGAVVIVDGQERHIEFSSRITLPCVGDWVAVHDGTIVTVLPRRTALVRGGVAEDSLSQTLASNVDVIFVVEPSSIEGRRGDPNLGRIERLLALAWESGATPVVLLTKSDLVGERIGEIVSAVMGAAPGVDVHPVCSVTGDGVDIVASYLGVGRTAVLVGPSGAGKSTLVNALAGVDVMETQQVRASDGRGRHTTVHRELLVLPRGGLIIDTPGIRRVSLSGDGGEGLEAVFTDIEELAGQCRFDDCGHTGEPDCAVLEAIESGELPQRRLDSWFKLNREAEWVASRTDARLRQERGRRWKVIHKEMRRSGRHRP
ncbi:ribosome small subunit-dependent GTPase A [Actinosynnema sp. ALI-1.44]|uniref:ribosome small subunit-dependent GTPase A n=1 Tax=Actinosynnema sp. ALI-1.44 TaxID=1933779 RepID=UPI00097BF133|nr:ribosome small subunit-dependent GTPase A [Actinosynnema sp. ALI-1.44]ONI77778.1 ribosome small subunit-dependent GTPase A [Actinosynnema sp. ALI-1.44]